MSQVARDVPEEIGGMIKKIHVARRQLALEEDSYRALVKRITGSDSLKALNRAQLESVIGEFKRLGWTPKSRAGSDKPQVRAVWALWRSMSGLVVVPNDAALRSFVQRQTGVADPEFCSPEQLNKVMEGLKAWKRRALAARA